MKGASLRSEHSIFSSTTAATGRQLKQSVRVRVRVRARVRVRVRVRARVR